MNGMIRSWAGLGLAASLLITSGCSEILEVNNPDEIPLEQLDDPRLLQVRLNGVVDAFDGVYVGNVMQYSNFPTDEIVSGLNWEDYERASRRHVSYREGPTTGLFEGLSRALRLADGLANDIRRWQQNDASADFGEELAQSLAYAGYSALMLAEVMCQTVISPDPDNPSGEVLDPLETFTVAIGYLEDALSVATAEGDAELANLARTGLARAHLGRGDWADVVTHASQVTPGFEYWIDFVDLPGGRNPLQGTSHGGNFTHGINPFFGGSHPSFDGTGFTFTQNNVIAPQTDPRIQHDPTDRTGHNGRTPLYKLFQGLRFSQYTGETVAPASATCPDCTGTPASEMNLLTTFDTDVLLADYTEAQHHLHEALAMQSSSDPAVLAFVNARREVGNQPPIAATGQALIDALRDQRSRDLFMGGFRLGDLRRWTRFDAGNGPFDGGSYFPTGMQHPNAANDGPLGVWTCFPIPLSEYEGNDNLTPPADPTVPPGI